MRRVSVFVVLGMMVASSLLAARARAEETPRAILEEGRSLYQAGDYAGAEAKFKAALDAQPRDYIALCLLGAAYLQQGKMDEAKQALDQCLEINPDYVPGLVNSGTWYLRKGQPDKAVEALGAAVEKGQGSGETYFNLGCAYLALKEPENAAAGESTKNAEKALESFTKAGELGVTGGELIYGRSLAKSALGDSEGALADAKAACEEGPGEVRYWTRLARLQVGGGNVKEAWEAVLAALKADPRDESAGVQLLRLLEEHSAEVLTYDGQQLQAMADAKPGCFYLEYGIGALKLAGKDLDGAAESFQKAVAAGTGAEQAQAQGRLGLVYLLQEKWDAAVHPLEESIKVYDTSAALHSNLALAMFHLAQWDRYESELNEVLRLDPGNLGALVSLGNFYAYRSEWDKAEEKYRLALAQRADDPDILGRIGRCQLGREDWDPAIETLQHATQLKTDSAELFFLLGAAYEGKGEWENALGAYKKVLEIDPNYQKAKDRIRILGGGG
jgi:tetratricopeptide (TPR) repeat protein